MTTNAIQLSGGWQLKQRDQNRSLDDDFAQHNGWIAATVPGSVHQDLLAAGIIPDPFLGLNEREVQWIGEADWLYRCRFEVPADALSQPISTLCFDGLDTIATVWLNGEKIYSGTNMFVPQRLAVGSLLKAGENELRILFESAFLWGKQREAEHGVLRLWNGDPSRLYVRKAQYHYGWDWGPTLLTAGPWREVRLENYAARIAELHCPIEVAEDLSSATLPVHLEIEGAGATQAEITVIAPDGVTAASATIELSGTSANHTLTLAQPQLWWPNGFGSQPLYRLVATLRNDAGVELAQQEQRIGVRRLRLIQEPVAGEEGTSFYFEVNNTALFTGGANWIPADSFTPRITAEHYRTLLQGMADTNMTMIRVWGGGIFEHDTFYDLCDELGLMVWQDFLFGCGVYPAPDWFTASVRAEAEAQVKRLRHHAALALWAGNNEDYSIAASLGLYNADVSAAENPEFPARAIYEGVLEETCATFDPTRPYRRGSPYGGANPDEPTQGDRHTWNVWHGTMAPYQDYPRYEGRFVSEFGMASFPNLVTIKEFAPNETDPNSPVIQHHQKADGGADRMNHYIADNFGIPTALDEYVYVSQLMQAEAQTNAYTGWRRRWGVPGKRAVGGALVWQWDDCWPTMSWALVDYHARPKAAVYAVKRALAALALGSTRANGNIELWAMNATSESVAATLKIDVFTLDGDLINSAEEAILLEANAVTEFAPVPAPLEVNQVRAAQLLVDGAVVARVASWPEPLKDAFLADPEVTIEKLGDDHVRVSVTRPAKGVLLAAEGDDVVWSDNLLDVLPNDPQIVTARGLGDGTVTARTFNDVLLARGTAE